MIVLTHWPVGRADLESLLSLHAVDDTVSSLDLPQSRNGATAASLQGKRQDWTNTREPRRDDLSEPEKECPRRESCKHVRPMR